MREILQPSLLEDYSEINGRNLEFYLGISDLKEPDLDGKVILNLGAGGSDLQGDLLKRGVCPLKVISVVRGSTIQEDIMALCRRRTGQ